MPFGAGEPDFSALNNIECKLFMCWGKEKDMIMPEVGQYYVFFLKKGTDAKQELYLPVNPIQGWLGLENDMLRAAEENKLFSSCPDLKELVRELNKA